MKLVKKNNKKGFTLIELVVVIAIIAVLALILIPSISGYVSRANAEKDRANARNIYTAAVLYASDEYDGELEDIVSTDQADILDLANATGSGCTISPATGSGASATPFSVTCGSVTFDGSND